MTKLKELIREKNKKTIENNQYIVLTSSQNGIVTQEEYFNRNVSSKDTTGYKIIERGQFTFRSMSDTGYFYINLLKNHEIGIVSPAYPVFEIIDPDILNDEYLELFFRSAYFLEQSKKLSKGSTRRSLKYKQLEEIDIELIPLEKQLEIVKIFNTLNEMKKEKENIIEDCKKAIDTVVQKEIIEEPQNKIVKLGDLFDVTSSKRVYQSEWRDKGIPFYRAREIVKLSEDGYVDNDLFIEPDMYEEYKEKYGVPQIGDIMVTGVGTLGIPYLVTEEKKFYFKDGNIIWLKNKDKISPKYVEIMFKNDYIKNQIQSESVGATVGTYTIIKAKNTKIPLPSEELQEKVVKKVTILENIISNAKEDIKDIDILSSSKMNKYFN